MTSSSRCIALLLQLIERDDANGTTITPHPPGSPPPPHENLSKLPDSILTHLAALFPESLVHEALRILDHATIAVFKSPGPSTPPPLSFAILIPPDPSAVGAANARPTLPLPTSVDGNGVSYSQIVVWIQQAMQHVLDFRIQQQLLLQEQQQTRRGSTSRKSGGVAAVTTMQLAQIWGQLPAVCLLNGNHCSCPAFRSLVVQQGESLVCPHILAAVLAHHSNPTLAISISASASADMAFHWMCGSGVFDSTFFPHSPSPSS